MRTVPQRALPEEILMSYDQWFMEDKPLEDAEIELLRSLARLTLGDIQEFYDPPTLPESIEDWLGQASLGEVRGLLIAVLRRWHEG